MEEHVNQIGLKRKDAIDRVKWRNGALMVSTNCQETQGEFSLLR